MRTIFCHKTAVKMVTTWKYYFINIERLSVKPMNNQLVKHTAACGWLFRVVSSFTGQYEDTVKAKLYTFYKTIGDFAFWLPGMQKL